MAFHVTEDKMGIFYCSPSDTTQWHLSSLPTRFCCLAHSAQLTGPFLVSGFTKFQGFPSGLVVENPSAMKETQETWVCSLGQEYPLEEEMATHFSVLSWKISWMEVPSGLHSKGSQRVGHKRDACTFHQVPLHLSDSALLFLLCQEFSSSGYLCGWLLLSLRYQLKLPVWRVFSGPLMSPIVLYYAFLFISFLVLIISSNYLAYWPVYFIAYLPLDWNDSW